MSFRSGLYVFAIGLLVAAGFAGKQSWDWFSAYQQQHSDERISASEHYVAASEKGPNFCGAIINEGSVFDWLACLGDNITADGSAKQSEYDLKAQQDMAAWAFGMLIVTCWLTVVTLVGVLFVGWTLFATRRMVKDTRTIGMAQVRAYISMPKARIMVRETSPMEVDDIRVPGVSWNLFVTLKNSGQSPAQNVLISLPEWKQAYTLSDLVAGEDREFFIPLFMPEDDIRFVNGSDTEVVFSIDVKLSAEDVFKGELLIEDTFQGWLDLVVGEETTMRKPSTHTASIELKANNQAEG